jgi:hypothetical protein
VCRAIVTAGWYCIDRERSLSTYACVRNNAPTLLSTVPNIAIAELGGVCVGSFADLEVGNS